MLAAGLLVGCYDYWTEANVQIIANETSYPEVINRVIYMLTARGY